MANTKNVEKIGSMEWYAANRELYTNEKGERYYDLPLVSVLQVVHQIEEETGSFHSWKITDVSVLTEKWVVVTMEFYQDGKFIGNWLGSAADTMPRPGEVSPVVAAETQALKSFFKKIYDSCNLPKALSIVEEEQDFAKTPEEVLLEEPVEKPKRKPAKKKVEEKVSKEAADEPRVVVEEHRPEEEVASGEMHLEDALSMVANVGHMEFDGKTIEEIASMPNGTTFLAHYAQRVDNKHYERFHDFCVAAKIAMENLGLHGEKPKH